MISSNYHQGENQSQKEINNEEAKSLIVKENWFFKKLVRKVTYENDCRTFCSITVIKLDMFNKSLRLQ